MTGGRLFAAIPSSAARGRLRPFLRAKARIPDTVPCSRKPRRRPGRRQAGPCERGRGAGPRPGRTVAAFGCMPPPSGCIRDDDPRRLPRSGASARAPPPDIHDMAALEPAVRAPAEARRHEGSAGTPARTDRMRWLNCFVGNPSPCITCRRRGGVGGVHSIPPDSCQPSVMRGCPRGGGSGGYPPPSVPICRGSATRVGPERDSRRPKTSGTLATPKKRRRRRKGDAGKGDAERGQRRDGRDGRCGAGRYRISVTVSVVALPSLSAKWPASSVPV